MTELIYAAIPAFILFMIVELLVGRYRGVRGYEKKDTAASLTMGVVNVGIGVGVDVLLVLALAGLYRFRIVDLPEGAWWVWLLAFFVFDFLFYWMHRFHHTVRVLWAAHVNHHSSERFNLSTALRQSWTEPLTALPFWLPMALLGFTPAQVLTVHALSLIYQFFVHTELVQRLGPLEWVFNTPSHHRVHHASDVEYLDRNYAGTLIIWDRLFGTFEQERHRPTYGLTTNIGTFNPLRIAFHEWAAVLGDAWRAPGLSAKLGTLFQPPGWRPGDDSGTVRVLQAKLREQAGAPVVGPPPAEGMRSACDAEVAAVRLDRRALHLATTDTPLDVSTLDVSTLECAASDGATSDGGTSDGGTSDGGTLSAGARSSDALSTGARSGEGEPGTGPSVPIVSSPPVVSTTVGV